MKKVLKLVVAGLLILSMTACTQNESTDSGLSFKQGTYSAVADGNGGPIEVKVEFSEKEIVAITFGEHKETKGLSDPAFDKIPNQIIAGQTLKVDAISGVTITSNAILKAVEDCVTQAGGDVTTLKNRDVVQAGPKEDIIKDAAVIVVGGGGAGLAAAVSAAENGASVILIEKGSALGGNTLRAGGGYNATDEIRQAKLTMEQSQITELNSILAIDESTFDESYRSTLATLKEQITTYLAGDTTQLFDSVEFHTYHTYIGGKRTGLDGTEIIGNFELVTTLTNNSLSALDWMVSHDDTEIREEVSTVLGGLWPRMHSLTKPVGTGFIEPFQAACEKLNVEIMLETSGTSLIVTDGKVTGVIAEQADGTKVTLNATNGVILATGGFGANPSLAMEYDNYWGVLNKDMKTTNSALSTGDGIKMGLEVNANLTGMGYIQLMPSSHPATGSLSNGLWSSAETQVFVNQEGNRFVSEYESRDVLAKAALSQTNGMFYIICDQESAGNPQAGGTNSWGNGIDDMIKNKDVYTADTLEELAVLIGIDPAALVASIEKYNGFTETGVDTDFNKVKIGGAIDVGPFWATPRAPSIHHTMGGLEINSDAQVLNTSNEVIPGLYAAGEVTGGIHAGNRVGGNALPDIIVFGKIAGASAAQAK